MAEEGGSNSPSTPPIFVDTSLGTHVALVVSPDETVAGFKRKVCTEHAVCFPSFGEVSALSLKVRRRSIYYHLSDSMLVRTAFDGIKGTWFLQMDLNPVTNSEKKITSDELNLEIKTHLPLPSPKSLLVPTENQIEPSFIDSEREKGVPVNTSASDLSNCELEDTFALTLISSVDTENQVSIEKSSFDGQEGSQNQNKAVEKKSETEAEAGLNIPSDIQCEAEEFKNEDGVVRKRLEIEIKAGLSIPYDLHFEQKELGVEEADIENQLVVDSPRKDKMDIGNSSMTELGAGAGIATNVQIEEREIQSKDVEIGSQSLDFLDDRIGKDDPRVEMKKSNNSRIIKDTVLEKKRKRMKHKPNEAPLQTTKTESFASAEKEKKKRKGRKEGDELYTELDQLHCSKQGIEVEPFNLESRKNDMFLNEEVREENSSQRTMLLETMIRKESNDFVCGDHMDLDSEVLTKEKKMSKHRERKVKSHNPSTSEAVNDSDKNIKAQGENLHEAFKVVNPCQTLKASESELVEPADALNPTQTLNISESESGKPDVLNPSEILSASESESRKPDKVLNPSKTLNASKSESRKPDDVLTPSETLNASESESRKPDSSVIQTKFIASEQTARISPPSKASRKTSNSSKKKLAKAESSVVDSSHTIEASAVHSAVDSTAPKAITLMQSDPNASNLSKTLILDATEGESRKPDLQIASEGAEAISPTKKTRKKNSSKDEPSVVDTLHKIEISAVHSAAHQSDPDASNFGKTLGASEIEARKPNSSILHPKSVASEQAEAICPSEKTNKTINRGKKKLIKDEPSVFDSSHSIGILAVHPVIDSAIHQSEPDVSNSRKTLNATESESRKPDSSVIHPKAVASEQTEAMFRTENSSKTLKRSKKRSTKAEISVDDSSHSIEISAVHPAVDSSVHQSEPDASNCSKTLNATESDSRKPDSSVLLPKSVTSERAEPISPTEKTRKILSRSKKKSSKDKPSVVDSSHSIEVSAVHPAVDSDVPKLVILMESDHDALNCSKTLNATDSESRRPDSSILPPETVVLEQTEAKFPSGKTSMKTSNRSKKSTKAEPSVIDSSHSTEILPVHSDVDSAAPKLVTSMLCEHDVSNNSKTVNATESETRKSDSSILHSKISNRSKKKSTKAEPSSALPVKDIPNDTDMMKVPLSEKDEELGKVKVVKKPKRISSKKPAASTPKNDKNEEKYDIIDPISKKDLETKSAKSAINGVKRKLGKSFEQEKSSLPASSSDTTEDESFQNNGHYRISVRKAPVKGSNKVVEKSNQEDIFRNSCDDTFGNFSSSSDDEVQTNISKSRKSGVSNPTMVIRGPKFQKSATPSGGSLSTAESNGDEIDQSQASNTSKKRIALSVLLRGSNSYRKAKLNVSESQGDVEFVPETQPEF